MIERIEALSRSGKWYLGGLDGVLWAPPFPRWADRPGFWDPAHLLHYEVGPCFSAVLLDAAGTEIPLVPSGGSSNPAPRRVNTAWRPGKLATGWNVSHGLPATEYRRVLPGGVLESAWALPREVESGHLAAFTAQPAGTVSEVRATAAGVKWVRRLTDRAGQELAVEMEIGGARAPAWRKVRASEGAAIPVWALSPFAETGTGDSPEGVAADDIGWIWIAVGFPSSVDDGARPALRMRMTPRLAPTAPKAESPTTDTPPDWPSFFASFPSFSSGDPHLDRYFDYRIHGLGLNRIEGNRGNIRHPCIAEGPEYFHVPITYSAQCHMMEMRWRAGGREAWGSLLNFLDNQKEDGSLHGRLYPNHLERTDFYHANWGDALLAVHALHPDPAALVRCYEGLSRYARWLVRSRDPEGSGMFTVVNHFETGQEYMSRYMAVDDEADVRGWEPRLRLKGIDVTVYAHQLFRALAIIARRLGREDDASDWKVVQESCACAMNRHMWCPDAQLFTDVDGRTGERTGVKAAVGFYPLLTGLVDGPRLDALLDHLEDPRTFGTPFPLPSSSVDDPRFSAEGIWRGKRRNCPWNGRVWPMTTSHVIEGLLRVRRDGSERDGMERGGSERGGSKRAGQLASGMLTRFVRMMFAGGDVERPNCFEHYNPYTGRACHFRGIDDYQHSWVLDLLARGVAGLEVDEDGLAVWPLEHGLAHVSMGPVRTRGHAVDVELNESRVSLTVDGERYDGERGRPLRVGWAEVGGGAGSGGGT